MVKDDCPPPRYYRPETHLKLFYSSDISLDMVKDNWSYTQVLQTRMSPNFCKFRFNLDMIKDDYPLSGTEDQNIT